MKIRNQYLSRIKPYVNKNVIKVLTGIRRSGKSTLLLEIIDYLKKDGVTDEQILHVNFELLEFKFIKTVDDLIDFLVKHTQSAKYIFLDEIQNINSWEIAVNGLFAENRYDIYITGSNSKLLSSELSTLLTGRYVEFLVNTLTFSEFAQFYGNENIDVLFDKFVELGGFPIVSNEQFGGETARTIIRDIYNSIVLNDTVERHSIRDVDLLNRIMLFIIDNVGNTFSAKSISNYLKGESRQTSEETVYSYLSYLEEAFVITRVPRYNLKGKQILKTNEKYYLGDHSIIGSVFGNPQKYIAGILENIVWKELVYRGYDVKIGKLYENEIDFVGIFRDKEIYIQVSYLMESDLTWDREVAPLKKLKTSFPKYILTMDRSHLGNYDGIECVYLPQWLLGL